MKKILLTVLFLQLTLVAVAQPGLSRLLQTFNDESLPYMQVEQLYDQLQDGSVLILDAREADEYAVSHIPGALHVGYSGFDRQSALELIGSWKGDVLVYCSLGIRSEDVAEKLKKAGVDAIYNLYGGIFEWANREYPLVDLDGSPTIRVHAYSPIWGIWLNKGTKVYE